MSPHLQAAFISFSLQWLPCSLSLSLALYQSVTFLSLLLSQSIGPSNSLLSTQTGSSSPGFQKASIQVLNQGASVCKTDTFPYYSRRFRNIPEQKDGRGRGIWWKCMKFCIIVCVKKLNVNLSNCGVQ